MPIYEYRCGECGNAFAKLVFNQDTDVECPGCKSKNVEKTVSAISSSSGGSAGQSMGGGCLSPSGFR